MMAKTYIIKFEVKFDKNRNKLWLFNDKLHRECGPAIECADGSKHWFLNGERHRIDGPAIEDANGDKEWFVNGLRHREDGPAIEDEDGYKAWYLNGVYHSREEFNRKMNPCSGKIVEIDGKKYRLQEI